MKKKTPISSTEFFEMSKTFCWVINVVDSCDKVMQIGSCYKLIDLYVKKYEFVYGKSTESNELKTYLETKTYYKMRSLIQDVFNEINIFAI